MQQINQNSLLNLIRGHAPVSRTQLQKLSGLSLSTILSMTSTLIEQHLVVETSVAESTGGRKAGLLEISPDGGYVIGIDLREQEIRGTLLNLHGNVIYADSWPAPLRNNATQAVDIIARGVEAFFMHTQIPRAKILGLGCGVSGCVNAQTGVNIDNWMLNWQNVEIGNPLREQLKLPVFVDNVVNCLASYEKLYGHGQSYHNFLLITLGRVLGLSVVLRDEIFRGGQGVGVDFGHVPFVLKGRPCACGKRGCLETYLAIHGMFTTYHGLNSMPSDVKAGDIDEDAIDDLFEQAQQGDASALKTFELTGTYLGVELATLVNLFHPECILIKCSGGKENWPALLQEAMQAALREHLISPLSSNLTLIVEHNPTMLTWPLGAGCLMLREFFSSPGISRGC
jgi:predicted NBD/HSP70 family sugar kinase